MKKISLIVVLALVMVGVFSAVALADITHPNNYGTAGVTTPGTAGYVYLPGDPTTTPIHSNYTANTDACAACHAPHTANGDALTQWDTFSNNAGFTNTCMACHDGTVTATYNVIQGKIGATGSLTNAGLFAVTKAGDAATALANSASQHDVFSGLTVNAAFGGAAGDGTANTAGVADANGSWSAQFDCTACHSPHGQGGNARILNPDPNGVQTAKKIVKGPVTFQAAAVGTVPANVWVFPNGDRPILGYPYGVTVFANGATFSSAKVNFTTDGTMTPYLINIGSTTATITATYVPDLKVSFTVANKLASNEKVTYNYGINNFCGACHTDYNTENLADPTGTLNGTYSQHTRHKVGYQYHGVNPYLTFEGYTDTGSAAQSNTVTCLTCHYAHGVDQSRWAAEASATGMTAYNTSETAGSSRLKRLPNMATCESCHDKEDGNYSSNAAQQLMK